MAEELGEMPEPRIEPAEPNPGGVDAIEPVEDHLSTVPDANPHANPALEDVPDVLTEPDDTDTEATSDGASEPQSEDPA